LIPDRSSPFSTEPNAITAGLRSRVEEIEAPLLVCEPVLTEALYLLARYPRAQDALFELLQNGALSIVFRIEEHVGALRRLLQKVSRLTDVAGRRLRRTYGRDLRPACRPDTRF